MILERFAYTPIGTFGVLMVPSFRCYTVECPWQNNEPWVSCIPIGDYPLVRTTYHAGGYETLEVCNVPKRSEIKIHKGNTHMDVQGCIALGAGLGFVNNLWAVIDSTGAFNSFWARIESEMPASFTIRNKTAGDFEPRIVN